MLSLFGGENNHMSGGYRSNSHATAPLVGHVKGLKKFSLDYRTEIVTVIVEADLDAGTLCSEIGVSERFKRDGGMACKRKLDPEEAARLSEAVFADGLLNYNGYNVHVNGLPLIEECDLSMEFYEGKPYYLHYNGGRGPANFRAELVKLWPLLFELGRYAPGKGKPPMPPMPAILGSHRFEFADGKKRGTLTANIETLYRRENVVGQGELISEGDFGKKHFRVDARYVTSGNGRYDLGMVQELEDSVGKTPDNWHFAAMITRDFDGNLMCEAYSAMPGLEDRKAVYEVDPKEKLASAFFYCASGSTYKTACLFREDRESKEFFLRLGHEDPASGRFFYSVYKADPEALSRLEELALTGRFSQYREYFALGSEVPSVAPVWLELNYRYGRSVILSVDRIQAVAERLKDERIKEAHLWLFQQIGSVMEEAAAPEKLVKQGVCPSGAEVVKRLAADDGAYAAGTGERITVAPATSEKELFVTANGELLMERELPVKPGEELSEARLLSELAKTSAH